jgi:hypothetical protein
MFITELRLYINYLKEQLEEDIQPDQIPKKKKYFASFYQNLLDGITYYRRLPGMAGKGREQFDKALNEAEIELDFLNHHYVICENQFSII